MNINFPLDDLSANRTQTSDIPTSEVKKLCRATDVGRTVNGYKFTAIERGDIVDELRYAHIQNTEIESMD